MVVEVGLQCSLIRDGRTAGGVGGGRGGRCAEVGLAQEGVREGGGVEQLGLVLLVWLAVLGGGGGGSISGLSVTLVEGRRG